ncbi:sulfate ABC transporter substrate-binding protein [Loigolactobacillus binensis]|uniref:Sulfate ABC transporter substrate-binding protein n=1 Tax=Loigolactobacillus binensis TaxID=2559922 RepID=A0ABW3EA12_9LACO|nr:sulfate ABC transporter substrate-binding protein [Loigolactobacillus binensis]
MHWQKYNWWWRLGLVLVLLSAYGVLYQWRLAQAGANSTGATVTLTNVSYDSTREFYQAYDRVFTKYWQHKSGKKVTVAVSNGGSGKQANTVIDGNQADVVTLALAPDITSIQKAGLLNKGWQQRYPANSAPYTSTVVFLVRKGNPQQISGWADLLKATVKIVTASPKTSGGARWNYLAAWAYAIKRYHSPKKARQFVKAMYQNVTVLDSGARDATTTFVENGQGNVLVTWENEAKLVCQQHPGKYQIITPSISIKAEPSVAVVDSVAAQRGTTKVARAYIKYLYSLKAQRLAAQNFYRPTDQSVVHAYRKDFPKLQLVTIDDPMFGGWAKTEKKHFATGGIFDQIYGGG